MKVAVVGFGMMGRQIAQVFAQNGHEVAVTDENSDVLKKGLEEIEHGPYGLTVVASKGKMTREEATKVLARIRTTARLEDTCRDAELVIEAVFEDPELKGKIFHRIEGVTGDDSLLASNTSTLSINKIAAKIARKERVLGMHFFNPAQITKLVEIVKGETTSSDTLERALNIVRKIGKTPVVARDEPGFIANRLGLSLYMEASRLVEDRIATVQDIDTAMKLGYGHPMGPFEVADLVGLDTRLRNLESLYHSTRDPKWLPPKILRELVNQGYLGDPGGKKGSRGGYYEYLEIKR